MTNLGSLEFLKIQGYKSIKNLEIDLKPINILIGANGVGKSNFIGFFKYMKKILDKDLQLYTSQQGGANKILHFGTKTTNELKFGFKFPPNSYVSTLVPDSTDNFVFKEEVCYFKGDYASKKMILAAAGDRESKLPSSFSYTVPGFIFRYISDWKVYHFHDTSDTAEVKLSCNINDCLSLRPNASNLAAFLNYIKVSNAKSYKDIVKMIQRVAPFFHDFILEPEINNSQIIKLKWKHKGSDEYFDASNLSDGTIRFICLTTLLLQPNLPTIILLDEPELGLHPFALNLLASMFKKVSRKTQIIASTQSVTFADNFDVEDVIVANRIDNATNFKRLQKSDLENWLEEFSLGDIWQKNLIGGVPTYD